MMKTCKFCEQEKSVDNFYEFYDKWSEKKYVSSRCRPCHQNYRRESPTTPKNRKAEKLQLRYGLTYEQWEKIREEVNNACMICGITEEEAGRKLDVDHCHSTGKVRGILCTHCNNMLGHAHDNIAVLESAAVYLKNYGGGYKD
jgi:nitrate/TMAO reductase-like tetraheme cytochrome c subunit